MERLILCGGGHVSLEVAQIAQRLEFELAVIDDRPEFANAARFPMADRVLCMPFLEALEALGSRESDYYVILTRGHAFDRECLAKVLEGSYAYVGMIGSKTKVAAVRSRPGGGGRFPGNPGPGALSHRPGDRGPDPGGDRRVHLRPAGAGAGPEGPRRRPAPGGAGGAVYHCQKERLRPQGRGDVDARAARWDLRGHRRRRCGGAPGHAGRSGFLAEWRRETRKDYDLSHAAAELGMVCGGQDRSGIYRKEVRR